MHGNQGNRLAFENLETQKAFCSMAGKQVEQMDAVFSGKGTTTWPFQSLVLEFHVEE